MTFTLVWNECWVALWAEGESSWRIGTIHPLQGIIYRSIWGFGRSARALEAGLKTRQVPRKNRGSCLLCRSGWKGSSSKDRGKLALFRHCCWCSVRQCTMVLWSLQDSRQVFEGPLNKGGPVWSLQSLRNELTSLYACLRGLRWYPHSRCLQEYLRFLTRMAKPNLESFLKSHRLSSMRYCKRGSCWGLHAGHSSWGPQLVIASVMVKKLSFLLLVIVQCLSVYQSIV